MVLLYLCASSRMDRHFRTMSDTTSRLLAKLVLKHSTYAGCGDSLVY